MKPNDTALIRMVFKLLKDKYQWDYEYIFEVFYNSKVCMGLSNSKTAMFTFSPSEIVQIFEQEKKKDRS